MSRYFLISKEGEILSEQKGVMRSNCIDCLDRTNVTQVRGNTSFFFKTVKFGISADFHFGDDFGHKFLIKIIHIFLTEFPSTENFEFSTAKG